MTALQQHFLQLLLATVAVHRPHPYLHKQLFLLRRHLIPMKLSLERTGNVPLDEMHAQIPCVARRWEVLVVQ